MTTTVSKVRESRSVMSDSLWPHGLYSPWNSPGQNTGVGSLSLLQGIFPTQGSNPGLPHCSQILYQLSHKGSTQLSNLGDIHDFSQTFLSTTSWVKPDWNGFEREKGRRGTQMTSHQTLGGILVLRWAEKWDSKCKRGVGRVACSF